MSFHICCSIQAWQSGDTPGDTELMDMEKHDFKQNDSSSDEGISSGDSETSGDEEYSKDTTLLSENNDGDWQTGGITGLIMQVITSGFSTLICI